MISLAQDNKWTYMNTSDHSFIKHYINDLLPQTPGNLYDPVKYILGQKGKKIRFFLTIKTCKMYSGSTHDALQAAMAMELFHNFTLIHDDIMDNAATRRNLPAVHEKWDTNTGILSGDVMLILAYESLLKSPGDVKSRIMPLFTRTAREVCEGQQMDIDFESLPVVQMDKYIEMITKKTAVLLAAAVAIGGYCGGASREDAHWLYEYGKNLGIAFQIRDDILDCYGETHKVGKEKAGDILQGKKTILYLRTWMSLPEENQERFTQLYHGSKDDKIERVLKIFETAGAKEYALQKEQEYFNLAHNALEQIQLSDEKKAILTNYTGSIIKRDR